MQLETTWLQFVTSYASIFPQQSGVLLFLCICVLSFSLSWGFATHSSKFSVKHFLLHSLVMAKLVLLDGINFVTNWYPRANTSVLLGWYAKILAMDKLRKRWHYCECLPPYVWWQKKLRIIFNLLVALRLKFGTLRSTLQMIWAKLVHARISKGSVWSVEGQKQVE